MEEKRQNGRWGINRDAKVYLLEDSLWPLECVVSDICFKGAKISLKHKLPDKDSLNINIDLFDGTLLKEIEAVIMWHQDTGYSDDYGLYFKKIREEDKEKIYNFVYKNFPQEILKSWWRVF